MPILNYTVSSFVSTIIAYVTSDISFRSYSCNLVLEYFSCQVILKMYYLSHTKMSLSDAMRPSGH